MISFTHVLRRFVVIDVEEYSQLSGTIMVIA